MGGGGRAIGSASGSCSGDVKSVTEHLHCIIYYS